MSGKLRLTQYLSLMRKMLYLMALCLPVCLYSQAQPINILTEQLTRATTDTARARLSGELAWQMKFTDNDEALRLADEEIKYAPKDALRLADAYRTKALVYVIENKLSAGLDFYALCLSNARKAHSSFYEASCFSLMAGLYQDMGDYDKALRYYFEGLKVAQAGNDKRMTGTLCNNIASVYSEAGRGPELPLKYYQQALEQADSLNNFAFAELITSNMAGEYMRAGKKDSAEIMVRASQQFAVRSGSRGYEYAASLSNIGSIYFESGQYKTAETSLQQAILILDSLKRPINVLGPLSVLSQLYLKQNNIKLAEQTATRLLNNAKQYHSKPNIMEGYKILSDIAHSRKQEALALDYYKSYSAWSDSVFNDAKAKSVANVQSRAELAERELEIQYQVKKKAQENQLLKLQNSSLRMGAVAAILIVVLLSILAFLLWREHKLQKQNSIELKQRNDRIEHQSREKDILMQEIHHRVKNNLQIVSSLLNLQAGAVKDPAAKDALRESLNRVNSIALIHQKLYQQNDISAISLYDYVSQLGAHLKHVFNSTGLHISCTTNPPDLKLDLETSVPLGVILNELITNAIKYAGPNKGKEQIEIVITYTPDSGYLLQFSDNGPGLPDDFNIRTTTTLGLRMVNELTRQLKGSLTYTKVPESTFTISFPARKQ